jgi:type I restriction enzyme S subunit
VIEMDELTLRYHFKHEEFKDTEIGRIPKDWEVAKITKLFDLYKGTTPSTKIKEYWNGSIPFVTPTDITKINDANGIYLETTENYITEKGLKSKGLKLVPKDSILFTSRATIGYLAINKTEVAINQGIISLIPKQANADVTFFCYFLQRLKNLFENLAGGSTYKEISMSTFVNVNIAIPPLSEQQKIAEILSTVDEAIQRINGIIVKTERLKKGLMQELLTKGIGHKEFKDTEIGRIPKDWEVVKLGEIGTFQYGITTSAKEEDTGLKLLRITDIRDDGTINWSEVPFCEISLSELSKYMLKVGDVLFARIGATTGKTCYINQEIRAVFGSYLIRFLPDVNSQINTKFLHLFTQSEMYWSQVNRMKGGQLKKGLNTQLLREIKILLPPLEEQQKIAQVLSTVDKKLEIERNEKAKLEKIKQGLMDLLLTGKIRVKVNQLVP